MDYYIHATNKLCIHYERKQKMKSLHEIYPSFEKAFIDEIEAQSTRAEFRADDIILKQGHYIKSGLLILDGKLKVYREEPNGKEMYIYDLIPGESCAVSMILARLQKSNITIRVIEDAEVLFFPLSLAEQWMTCYHTWLEFVLNTYSKRFEELLEVIDHVAFCSMDERLEQYLNRLRSKDNEDAIFSISHQEIANDLNSSREVISRLLKKMEQQGKVKLHRNSIELISNTADIKV